jgi:hypothetical protein
MANNVMMGTYMKNKIRPFPMDFQKIWPPPGFMRYWKFFKPTNWMGPNPSHRAKIM